VLPNVTTSDGLETYWSFTNSQEPGGYGGNDIWMMRRERIDAAWGPFVNLGQVVNSPANESAPTISPDGLELYFHNGPTPPRPGGYGNWDLYRSRRASPSGSWGDPLNLGPLVNSPGYEENGFFSADGSTFFFDSDRGGGYGPYDIWQVSAIPTVDFNGDGKVDVVDLVMLIDNWGTNKALCDIGPMPWGDGKVDIEDLKVFMTYFEKENPPVKP
jgi:hypothetical protein